METKPDAKLVTCKCGRVIHHAGAKFCGNCGNVLPSDLKALAEPVAQFLRDNYDPHCAVVITDSRVDVIREEMGTPLSEVGQPED